MHWALAVLTAATIAIGATLLSETAWPAQPHVINAAAAPNETVPAAPSYESEGPPAEIMTMLFEASCANAESILAVQKQYHGQVPVGFGVVDDDLSLVLLVSPSGSWSVVTVYKGAGLACGVASGGRWRARDEPGRPK